MIGILLAAGFSHRFGPQNKLLQPLGNGDSIAVQAAKNLIAALPTSLAVVRPSYNKLAEQFWQIQLNVIACPDDKTEMADSLALAIEAASKFEAARDGYVIALADMPFIQPATIIKVVAAIQAGASIAMPSYQGQRGHPVGFSAKFKEALMAVSGEQGARTIIKRHEDELTLIQTDDVGVITDIDTLEDFMRYSQPR